MFKVICLITDVKIQMPEIAKKYLSGANLINILHLFDLCSDEASHFISSILKVPLFSPEKRLRFRMTFMHP